MRWAWLLVWCVLVSVPVAAQEAASTVPMRVVGGVSDARTGHLHFLLEPGWKTYGLDPGGVGVAPEVELRASANLASWELTWPADRPLESFGQAFRGYDRSVAVEVHVVPIDATRPVDIELGVAAASCARLCVPMEAQVDLVFPAEAGS